VLDAWVMRRLQTCRAADLGGIFDVESMALRGSAAEIRLWSAAGAALERAGTRPHARAYVPIHHAATGMAVMHWES
jgi:Flp pilus assembly protein TadD